MFTTKDVDAIVGRDYVHRMGVPQQYERYTYQDYLSWPEWPEGERWELIYGVAYAMGPAPTTGHQEILGEIFRQISDYLLDRRCRVFMAPVDVKLSSDEYDSEPTVVQPDLAITCRPETVTEHGIPGNTPGTKDRSQSGVSGPDALSGHISSST